MKLLPVKRRDSNIIPRPLRLTMEKKKGTVLSTYYYYRETCLLVHSQINQEP